MRFSALPPLLVGGLMAGRQMVAALVAGDADTMFNAWNNAFLVTDGGNTYYAEALNISAADGTWTLALDIFAAEDAYERTGDPNTKTLVEELLTSFNNMNPPVISWDGNNDDLGWDSLAMIRAYHITGDQALLTSAQDTFDFTYNRAWNTTHNGGGIFESQPDPSDPGAEGKCALAENSLGKVACMIYQANHDAQYLNHCTEMFWWSYDNLYDPSTGYIAGCVDQSGNNGGFTPQDENQYQQAYNQGTWADYANLVWEITLETEAYNVAEAAIDYARTHITVGDDQIFSKSDDAVATWADDVGRAVGHFARDNQQWDKYYDWMVNNANSILQNRRSDLGLTWNQWDTPTPEDNTQKANWMVSGVAWLQATPPVKPNAIGGIHKIVNKQTNMAVDSLGYYGWGNTVNQWAITGNLNQEWQITQNSDNSWNIINLGTWLALDNPKSSTADGTTMIQWQTTRESNQRWWIDVQPSGYYKIWNQQSSLSLDGGKSTDDGAPLLQWTWSGEDQQLWSLE